MALRDEFEKNKQKKHDEKYMKLALKEAKKAQEGARALFREALTACPQLMQSN